MSEHDTPTPSESAADATGAPRVDAALAPLRALDGAPIDEHPAVVEDVHSALQDILSEEQE